MLFYATEFVAICYVAVEDLHVGEDVAQDFFLQLQKSHLESRVESTEAVVPST